MKMFVFLSCVSTAFAAIAGDLTVTITDDVVNIKGALTGLPADLKDAGIHVHTGTDCTNGGFTTTDKVNQHIGGHLNSNSIDGWVFPVATTYNTDGAGAAAIDIKAKSYALGTADDTPAKRAVEGHCVVLHGLAANDLSPRVAIGKITQDGAAYSAVFGKYPGPNDLQSTPAGKLTVTLDGDEIRLMGDLTGLALNLVNAGIHVHSGSDCSGGSDLSTKDLVNGVVGGHLLSGGDGYYLTKYDSDAQGAAAVDVSTPKGSYTLNVADKTDAMPAVENQCIVIHSNDNGARIGVGQIVCSGTGCKATMAAYPVPAAGSGATTTTAGSGATTTTAGSGATTTTAGSGATTAIAGDLTVTITGNVVNIKGGLTGLPADLKDAGIHVHTGTDCTNGGFTTTDKVNQHIGGHLNSNSIDGWVFPVATTYNTDGAGAAAIDIKAKSYALATADDTPAKRAVEGHCVVLHGLAANDLSPRVAIGKIAKDGTGAYSADFELYPGPNDLQSTPAGKLTVTLDGDEIRLMGDLTGLALNLVNAGIHVHSGSDCSGGSDLSTKDLVNGVVGGHLLSGGDGYYLTKYDSDAQGAAAVDVSTPKGSYTLKVADKTDAMPAVENQCIVIHSNDNGARIGVGQIVCSGTGCKATMAAYPMPATAATTTGVPTTGVPTTTTEKEAADGAANVFLAFFALAIACFSLHF